MAGGAGYKAVLVERGQADLLTYCSPYTKKWASCAGQAIIRSLGGYFISGKGEEIFYDPKAKSYLNQDGIICGFDQKFKESVIKIYEKYIKANL